MVLQGFVTREAENVASSIENQLEAGDIQPLGLIALSAAGGVVIAQEIADRVLPMLGFADNPQRTPEGATGFAVSGALKGVIALAVGALAGTLSGLPLVFAVWAAVGHLASAGADFVNAVQRTGLLAEDRQFAIESAAAGGSGNANRPPLSNGGGHSQDGYTYG